VDEMDGETHQGLIDTIKDLQRELSLLRAEARSSDDARALAELESRRLSALLELAEGVMSQHLAARNAYYASKKIIMEWE
tara:strand:- start:28419 stop:28658 length:240 start_codon:yes stop_codon:yes gene_type:complete